MNVNYYTREPCWEIAAITNDERDDLLEVLREWLGEGFSSDSSRAKLVERLYVALGGE